ncbi:tripartite tricarboxylate transporter substrate binding protein [Roseomonas sp. BN140053]|uniref:tripartite tricarboxylate transporter substrate binding protein n=1 Tax=Roseomonas sp. BN140053 TaxID=3391898 RepID=UPI0039EC170F
MLSRRSILAGSAAASLAPALPAPLRAQSLSGRPVTVVVGITGGTTTDILARLIADRLQGRWHQPFVVDNRAGASGNIAAQNVARAAPDGHTLLMAVNTLVMNPPLFATLPYDPVRDFAPITLVGTSRAALVVHPSLPARSVAELVRLAKEKPGVIDYASPGVGTPFHMGMELFKLRTGTELTHIPYRGSAMAWQDFAGGRVKVMFASLATALSLAKEGNAALLALSGDRRSPLAPAVPTLAEVGLGDVDAGSWYGVAAPAGTPDEILDRYNAAIREIIAEPAIQEQMAGRDVSLTGTSRQEFAGIIAADLRRWTEVVQQAGIKPE